MSDSEALESTLQTKLTHFEITQEKTGDALKTEKRSTIARHMETLKNTHRCGTRAESGRSPEDCSTENHSRNQRMEWNAGVGAKVVQADENLEILEEWLREQKLKQDTHEQEERM